MKKNLIKILAVIVLTAQLITPALAYNYTFTSGADSKIIFDRATQSDGFTEQNPYENVRSDKDAAYAPTPYGLFGGDIPTEQLSLYHTQDKSAGINVSNVIYSEYSPVSADLPMVSGGEILPATSVYSANGAKLTPIYYADGSIGSLEFSKLGKTIKVYEGETLENMRLGAGHFASTSAWDGNCAIAAHNRGVENNFSFLKDLKAGDKIIYTTKYGVRTYKVTEKRQVLVDDTSVLEWSDANILTLVTCVEGAEQLRLVVTAVCEN